MAMIPMEYGGGTRTGLLDTYNTYIRNDFSVTIRFNRTGRALTMNQNNLMFTLPEDCRPTATIYAVIEINVYAETALVTINTDGTVYINPKRTTGDVWIYDTITYALA